MKMTHIWTKRKLVRFGGSSFMAWVWAISLVLAPLTYVLVISFMSRGTYGGVVMTPHLDNYRKIFEPGLRPLIFWAFMRSVGMATITTILCLLFGFPLAMFLVFRAGRMRQILFFLLVIPFWTQFLIRVYAWMSLLSENGLISKVFGVHWLFTYKAIFIGMLYNYLPYMTMSLYVNLEKLDWLLIEAAADLGASNWTRFRKIIWPLTMPGIVAGSIMVFIPSLGEFVIPDVLGGAKKFFVGNLLAQQFLSARNWPFGSALSVALILLVALSFWVLSRIQRGSDIEEMF